MTSMQADLVGNHPTRFYDFLPTPKTAVKAGVGIVAFLAIGAGIVCTLMGKKIIPIDISNTSNVLIGTGSGLIGFGGIVGSGLAIFLCKSRKSFNEASIDSSRDDVRVCSSDTLSSSSKETRQIVEKFKQRYPGISVLELDNLGEPEKCISRGSGHHSVIFPATYQGKQIVYKLENCRSGPHGKIDYFMREPNDDYFTESSFESVSETIPVLLDIQDSPYFPKFIGIIYIKDKKQFGWAFEKIEGENLQSLTSRAQNQLNQQERIKVMLDIARGLKDLEDAGYVHNDLFLRNFMVQYPQKRGFLVDHEESKNKNNPSNWHSGCTPMQCRNSFCSALLEMLKAGRNPQGLQQKLYSCNTWEEIITTLVAYITDEV